MPPYRLTLPVRFSDIDHAGIVYFARFFHFAHLALEEFFRQRIGGRAYARLLDRDHVGFPAVETGCRFLAPLRFGDLMDVELAIVRLGRSSIEFRFQVFRRPDPPDGEPAEPAGGSAGGSADARATEPIAGGDPRASHRVEPGARDPDSHDHAGDSRSSERAPAESGVTGAGRGDRESAAPGSGDIRRAAASGPGARAPDDPETRRLCADGRYVVAVVDLQAFRAIPIPAFLREILDPLVLADASTG